MIEASRERLEEIGFGYGTDKSKLCHNYLDTYEAFFEPLRDEPITLLELGVQDGYSIRTWREYFPNATIVGIDDGQPPPDLSLPETFVYQCDQADKALPSLLRAHCPLDIVIDDCSHISANTIASFELLWPLVKRGGLYIIEDIACHDDTTALDYVKSLTGAWGHFGDVTARRMAELYATCRTEHEWIRLSRNLAIISKSPARPLAGEDQVT